MDPRMSYNVCDPAMMPPRQSVMPSNLIPILSPEEIQKLETLKRASIVNPEDGPRASIRPSYRPSIRGSFRPSVRPNKSQTPLKNKLAKKAEEMKNNNGQKDEIQTKRTEEPSFTSKASKRKDRAIQERDEGFFQKCCLSGENDDENPFRKARQSYLKH